MDLDKSKLQPKQVGCIDLKNHSPLSDIGYNLLPAGSDRVLLLIVTCLFINFVLLNLYIC